MTKEAVWNQIARQTQVNVRGELRLTPKGARQFFDLVWTQANELGVKNGRALERMQKSARDVPDFLKGIF